MADDDHILAAAHDRGSHVVDAGPGRQPLVRLGVYLERTGQLATGLPGAQERAREDGVRSCLFVPQPCTERAGLLAPCGREWAELVGVAGSGVGMANEVETHGK